MRQSGESARALELMGEYEKGNRPNLEEENIHTVSTLMKKYLNLVTDSLLTHKMYADWVALYGETKKKIFSLKYLITLF